MGKKIIIFIIIAWAAWYISRPEEEKEKEIAPQDEKKETVKLFLSKTKKPIKKIDLKFKKTTE